MMRTMRDPDERYETGMDRVLPGESESDSGESDQEGERG